MQKRHFNRRLYFKEQTSTSMKYYINYLSPFLCLTPDSRILEVGCGEGGNLVPFAQKGCYTCGIDMARCRIEQAKSFFKEMDLSADFLDADFLTVASPTNEEEKFDVILLHDVIEHVERKRELFGHLKLFLKKEGVVFVGFPAWRMPFGGHQQICKSHLCSHFPFVHLLPEFFYRGVLEIFSESSCAINELMSIRKCRMDICAFEGLIKRIGFTSLQSTFWLVNPHYEQKFGLKPRRLPSCISRLNYVREFLSTSCWYVLKIKEE